MDNGDEWLSYEQVGTGAIHGALASLPNFQTEFIVDDSGNPTNQIAVRFLGEKFVVTVEHQRD